MQGCASRRYSPRMAQDVTFKNIWTQAVVIAVSPGNPGAPSVSIAANAEQVFDLDLNDALTKESLRHALHAGTLCVCTTP